MASKKPGWLTNAEAKDAQGKTVVTGENNKNKVTTNIGGPSYATGDYTIGSDAGKNKAQNMAIGTAWYNTNDGSNWVKENDGTITVYHNGTVSRNAYTPSDYSINGRQQMDAGVPWQVLYPTYTGRQNKALNTPGLEQYADDPLQKEMWRYILDGMQAEYQPQEFTFNQARPTYEDKYDPEIDALLDKILNRDAFKYDAASDPLYQQYQAMYQREGDRAMRETMAEAAAGAGGMNSYAITAAQQANNYYNAQLADRIPELYQLAYDMHLAEKDSEIQKLGILQNMSDSQYARYRDTMNDWQNDRNFAYGMYQDDVAQGNWQTQFDYNTMMDDRNFNYGVNQDRINNQWKQKEWEKTEEDDAKATIEWMIGMGASFESIDPNLIAKSGLSENAIKEMIANNPNANFKSASSGSGGGRRSSYGSDVGGPEKVEETVDNTWERGLSDLGLSGTISPYLLVELENAGAIYEKNGKLHWASGWNAQNYELNLRIDPKLRPNW